jgi:Terminase large subunit, T4likevirus-type, N-terminal
MSSAPLRLALHPKQSQVFASPARQILFGGAAGPGKSMLLRVAGIAWAYAIPGLQVYLFRRTYPDLYKNHMEGPTSLPALLAPWVAEGFVKINYAANQIVFAHGSKIHLLHMQHESDTDRIQGAEIHVALIDELTHFTKAQYSFIRSRVRMTGLTIPAALAGRFPRLLTASNPGGPGHGWVRDLFVDRAPWGTMWEAPPEEGGLTTQFIPALLRDNPTLLQEDPTYADRLRGLSSPELVRAMLEGDWNALLGGMFDDVWRESVHVIEPFEVPASWRIRRAFDWGSSKPFSVGWWAHADGAAPAGPTRRVYLKGTRFRIHELYGWNGKPNEGLRMTNTDIARWMREIEDSMPYKGRIEAGPADSQIFDVVNGTSIAQQMAGQGISFKPAQKGPGSRRQGWSVLRQLLKASLAYPMEEPGLFVFNTCRQFIRTVPVLPRDKADADDVDTDSEDHIADETRYECTMPLTGRPGTIEVHI